MDNYFFLAILALMLFLLPLHSLITAELVLTATLLIFYAYLFLSRQRVLSFKTLLGCLTASIFLAAVFLLSMTRPINAFELYRLLLIIWLIPFLEYCFHAYGSQKIIRVLLVVLAVHAQWGILQFIVQHDLGFNILGETVLSASENGVAKFSVGAFKLIRSYGPYAHANIFGAAMLMGFTVISIQKKYFSLRYTILLQFLFLLGIFLSFSRSVFIGLLLLLILLFLFRKKYDPHILRSAFSFSVILLLLFSPLLFFRFTDAEDRGISERISALAWNSGLTKNSYWWRGFGPGSYESALKKYLDHQHISYQTWEIQPLHSAPLLLVAEWGLVPAVLFIVAGLRMYRWSIKKGEYSMLILGIAVMPLFLTDHYFATETAPLVLLIISGWVVGTLQPARSAEE